MAYAEKSFELSKPDDKGVSLKSHLETAERQTGVRPEELNLPEFPELLINVWRIFIDLSNSRNQGFSGVTPITFEQMKAYNEIMGNTIGPAEVNVIKKLDKKYLEIVNG